MWHFQVQFYFTIPTTPFTLVNGLVNLPAHIHNGANVSMGYIKIPYQISVV